MFYTKSVIQIKIDLIWNTFDSPNDWWQENHNGGYLVTNVDISKENVDVLQVKLTLHETLIPGVNICF